MYRTTCVCAVVIGLGIALAVSNSSGATVAYYRFEEGTAGAVASGSNTILDSSGNNISGTPSGSPVYTANVPANPLPGGGPNNLLAMKFDGDASRIAVPNVPALSITHGITLEAFVYSQPLLAGVPDGNIIFRGDDGGGNDPYRLTVEPINATTQRVLFQVASDSITTARVNATIPMNQWVHVAGTLDDATGAMKIYVNGVAQESIITSVRPFELLFGANPGIGIGALQSGSTFNGPEYFHGMLDEVRISNVALRPDQFVNAPEPSFATLSLGGLLLLCARARRR
jgi:hypothetical protein